MDYSLYTCLSVYWTALSKC